MDAECWELGGNSNILAFFSPNLKKKTQNIYWSLHESILRKALTLGCQADFKMQKNTEQGKNNNFCLLKPKSVASKYRIKETFPFPIGILTENIISSYF